MCVYVCVVGQCCVTHKVVCVGGGRTGVCERPWRPNAAWHVCVCVCVWWGRPVLCVSHLVVCRGREDGGVVDGLGA